VLSDLELLCSVIKINLGVDFERFSYSLLLLFGDLKLFREIASLGLAMFMRYLQFDKKLID